MPLKVRLLEENLRHVTERIGAACERAGRSPDEVCLIAVTKYAQAAWIRDLIELGVYRLGESRPQQLVERAGLFSPDVEWHLIGHLQRNKVALVLPNAAVIHSVDSLRLLQRIDQSAREQGRSPRILLEVNVSGESAKQGFAPQDLLSLWPDAFRFVHMQIEGLMTMAPQTTDQVLQTGVFRGLRELRDRLREKAPSGVQLAELSMGMSGDYELAVQEGATMVRIGSALFDGLEA